MVASILVSAFFQPSPSSSASVKPSRPIDEGPNSLDMRGIVAKPAVSSGIMQLKTNAHAVPKVNGTKISLKPETHKAKDGALSYVPRMFYNQIPNWRMLLATITTIFWAVKKQWTPLGWKPGRPHMLAEVFSLGKIVQDGLVFIQNFYIRSYEIGADGTVSIQTLMNHLQETALNHFKAIDLMDDGFGSTPEMSKQNLIWVVTKMKVLLEKYPSWGDVVQVQTWTGSSGKNGMHRDWQVIDYQSGEIVVRATSIYVLMNKSTRKLTKMLDEVRAELAPYCVERAALVDEDNRKLPELNDDTTQYYKRDIVPHWGDLDMNQHINNVKYIGWILQGIPTSLMESHELIGMTLEYRKECGRDSVLQSLAYVSECSNGPLGSSVECAHLLQLKDGVEIMRARTKWQPKHAHELTHQGVDTD